MPTPLSKNLLAGLMFIAFGLFGLWLGRDLDAGTAGDMGPGVFPASGLRAADRARRCACGRQA